MQILFAVRVDSIAYISIDIIYIYIYIYFFYCILAVAYETGVGSGHYFPSTSWLLGLREYQLRLTHDRLLGGACFAHRPCSIFPLGNRQQAKCNRQQPAAASSSQQQPAAASSSQQQPAAATASSQQQPAAASSSQQQRQPAASSSQEWQPRQPGATARNGSQEWRRGRTTGVTRKQAPKNVTPPK